jgi:hypothetical protein
MTAAFPPLLTRRTRRSRIDTGHNPATLSKGPQELAPSKTVLSRRLEVRHKPEPAAEVGGTLPAN